MWHDAPMFSIILAALDGSPREPLVFHRAVELAKVHAAKLHLVRAVTIPIGLPDAVWSMSLAQLDAALVAEAEKALRARADEHPGAVAATHVRIGQPADVVEDLAREVRADLVIIGAHGYRMAERLIGTTASKIVHRVGCSVLVVRTPEPSA